MTYDIPLSGSCSAKTRNDSGGIPPCHTTGIDYKVKTVCVRPCDIDMAAAMCQGTETEVSCVLSFPHGTSPSQIKAAEAQLYIQKGAHEIDMVANYGYIRSKLWDEVEKDIRAVSEITQNAGVPLKVIFETSQLTVEEIAQATECAIRQRRIL